MAKKMTKAETKSAAQHVARQHSDDFTLDQLEALGYDGRRDETRTRSKAAADVASGTGASFDADLFRVEFEQALMNIWGGRLKERDRARRNWQDALRGLTTEQAAEKVTALLESMRIRGARVRNSYGVDVTVERAWGVGADLSVRFEPDREHDVTNPDDAQQRAGTYELRTQLTWSSTGRTIAEAQASIALYQEMVNAAAEVEAVMRRERVIWTRGLPEPEPLKAEDLAGAADPRQSDTVQS